jgi:hypothetical protein
MLLLLAVALGALGGCGTSRDLPQGDDPVTLDGDKVGPDVTNEWFPLKPGTRWTYRETDAAGQASEVTVTATPATRRIADGVRARVVRDTVRTHGVVVEDTFDWYAQDAEGNVWYLGENTAEFDHGRLASREGSFEAGVDGALPGIIMPARPEAGLKYRQEYYRGHAEDNGEVLGLHRHATVPLAAYSGLLETKDTNSLEPTAVEHKFFAVGIGAVLTIDTGEGSREELLRIDHISLAMAQRAASTALGKSY